VIGWGLSIIPIVTACGMGYLPARDVVLPVLAGVLGLEVVLAGVLALEVRLRLDPSLAGLVVLSLGFVDSFVLVLGVVLLVSWGEFELEVFLGHFVSLAERLQTHLPGVLEFGDGFGPVGGLVVVERGLQVDPDFCCLVVPDFSFLAVPDVFCLVPDFCCLAGEFCFPATQLCLLLG